MTEAKTIYFQSGFSGFEPVKRFTKGAQGQSQLSVTGVPVFRSGTFADSLGDVMTWTPLQMSQAVANFNSLKDTGVVASVPVRKGHGALFGDRMDTLIGWHTGLTVQKHANPVDGSEQTYLLADFDIFDEQAMERISNGDWPNRSAEIGTYFTNDNAEIFPAYLGFAFVDLPAVEGLNFGKQDVEQKYTVLLDQPVSKENSVSAPAAPPVEPGATTPPAVPAVPPVAPTPPAAVEPPAAAPAQFTAPVAPSLFKVNGSDVSDFAAVQSHITGLETFRKETLETARKDFVSNLAKDNKIVGAQIEPLQAFALGLSEDSYTAWVATYETAVANPAFANHTAGANNTGAGNGRTAEVESELQTVTAIVNQHKLAGMPKEKLEKLTSYQRMIALEAAGAK